jgi:hypothetical protein
VNGQEEPDDLWPRYRLATRRWAQRLLRWFFNVNTGLPRILDQKLTASLERET